MGSSSILQFGSFTLDPAKRLLLRHKEPISISPKAFDLLLHLIEKRDRVVLKDELLRELWPDVVVDEATLAQHVFIVRRILGSDGDASTEYIATATRRGYRFVAAVTPSANESDRADSAVARGATDAANDHGTPTSPVKAVPRRPVVHLMPVAAFALTIIGAFAAGRIVGMRAGEQARRGAPPKFMALTSQRGFIPHARFTPDDRTIVYGAAWEGESLDVFLTRVDSPEARALGFPGSSVLAVSSRSDLALSLGCSFEFMGRGCLGTLATVPLAGGAPRPVAENVRQADWSPDGSQLVVTVENRGGRTVRLEYPVGHVMRTSQPDGWIGHPRISPRGDRIAFFETESNGDVSVQMLDLAGRVTTLASGFDFGMGLAWSADGTRVWFSDGFVLHVVTTTAQERMVWRGAGPFALDDLSRDGHMLLDMIDVRLNAAGRVPGNTQEQDLSYHGWTYAADLSRDGKDLLFHAHGYRAMRESGDAVYLRRSTTSPPVRLGGGHALALSPDGRQAITISDGLEVVPTGPGQPRPLPRGGIASYYALTWLPDGDEIVFAATESGHAPRCYVQDITGGPPRPVTAEGVTVPPGHRLVVTPDGRFLTAASSDRRLMMYPLDGGAPVAVRGIQAGDEPVAWSRDSLALYVRTAERFPARLYRVDQRTGNRELWKELMPSDAAGVIDVSETIGHVLLDPDSQAYVYNYLRWLNDLQLVAGMQ